jgi:hypothetical protein
MPETERIVVNPCCETFCAALLAGAGSVTPPSWSMKFAPTAAPMSASTIVTTKASRATNSPCLTPERLAIRPTA